MQCACKLGNYRLAIPLIKGGADNFEECIRNSQRMNHILAFLRLCEAAQKGDHTLIRLLLCRNEEEVASYSLDSSIMQYNQILLPLLDNGKLSVAIPIQVALKYHNSTAAVEILTRSLRQPVLEMIDWHGLELESIHSEWLKSVDFHSLNLFCLSFNQLKEIPSEVSKFKNLQKLQMASNEISFVPSEIFCLERIENIDLSYNCIACLPEMLLGQVSQSLRILNISNNQLTVFPDYFSQSKLIHLDLSNNRFQEVPRSLCLLRHLDSLNLSKNYNIKHVLYELGGLRQLKSLALEDVPNAVNIPDSQKCSVLKFLQDRFKSMQTVTHYEVQVIGFPGYAQALERIVDIALNSSLKCNVLKFTSPLKFLFLFDIFELPNTVYIVPWDYYNCQPANDLHLVLRHLSIYAPTAPVIVAACWKSFLQSHSELEVEDIISNSLWKDLSDHVLLHHVLLDDGESISEQSSGSSSQVFIDSIVKSSEQVKMTTFVPSSYYSCAEILKSVCAQFKAENKSMFVSEWDFWELVRSMPSHDLSSHFELPELVQFLCSKSSILHLPSPKENQTYYVLDRQWYCDVLGNIMVSHHSFMMARNTAAIVRQEGLVDLLGSSSIQSPIPIALQYVLNWSGISLALSSERWLVPSLLKKKSDSPFSSFTVSDIRKQYTFSLTPLTFIGRLITHLLINMESLIKQISSRSTVSSNGESYLQPGVVDWSYWSEGITCWKNACNLVYSIEKIDIITEPFHEAMEIRVPNSFTGYHTMQILTFVIDSLLKNWYPTIWKTVAVWIPCSYCIYTECSDVPSISFQDCLLALSKGVGVRCVQHTEKIVTISKIVPDLVQLNRSINLFLLSGTVSFDSSDKSTCLSPAPTETVFKGTYNNMLVAVKPIPQPVPNLAGKDSRVQKAAPLLELWMEFEVLLHLHNSMCPFILNMIGMCPSPLCLVFPFAKWSSLEEVICVKEVPIPRLVRMRMIYQVSHALEVLHSKHVIHRNISLENILVYSLSADDDVNVKLSGFSDACYSVFQGVGVGCYGTFPAPEMLSGMQYDERVDIFAFGFVAYEILTRSSVHVRSIIPFEKSSKDLMSNERPSLKPVRSRAPYVCDLLSRCWNPDPFKRPYASKILEHLRDPLHTLVMDGNLISKDHAFYAASAKFTRVKSSFHTDVFVCSGELSCQSTGYLTHFSLPDLSIQNTVKLPSEYVICMGCVGSQLWVSFFGRKLCVYSTTRNLDLLNEFTFTQHVVVIAVNPTSVYLGLENGVLQVYDIMEQNTPEEPRHTKTVSQGDEFKSIESLEDSLVCATKDSIYRLHPDTLEREAKWPLKGGAEIRSIIVSEDGTEEASDTIWVSFRRTDQVQVLDAWHGKLQYTIHCSKILAMKSNETWVYSMRLVLDTVWIGLNTGHVLVFAVSAASPSLVTHLKVHCSDVRQLLLLHPSYMGPSTILSANEMLRASEKSKSERLSPNMSLSQAVTFPESVQVLSIGTGLSESPPQMDTHGEGDDSNIRKRIGLFAVVLEGSVQSKIQSIEKNSLRESVMYMSEYKDKGYETVQEILPLETLDEDTHVLRVDTWSSLVKHSPVHSKFTNLTSVAESSPEYVTMESVSKEDQTKSETPSQSSLVPPPLPPRSYRSGSEMRSPKRDRSPRSKGFFRSKEKLTNSSCTNYRPPRKSDIKESVGRSQSWVSPSNRCGAGAQKKSLDVDPLYDTVYDPYVTMDSVRQSFDQIKDLSDIAQKARPKSEILIEKDQQTDEENFVSREDFLQTKEPPPVFPRSIK